MRALKYLKDHLLSLLLIAALLVAQAWCDLSLPGYTQKIVDVGISQGGVETACPDTLRPEAMRAIKLFLPDGEAFYYDDLCFYKESDGLYHYCGNKLISNTNHDDREKIAELTGQSVFNLLQFVMARMNSAGGGGAMDMSGMAGGDLPQIDIASPELTAMLDAIEVMLESGVMTKQELLETQSPLDDMSDEMQAMARDKIGVAFVRSEYAAQGIDMQKYQTDYMWRVGGMMLALTLVSVAAAILVTFLASRVGAGIARELRRRLFKRTLAFSKTEIDKFSTASLITRGTNDVQLIQMMLTMAVRMLLYAPIIGVGAIIKVWNEHTGLEWIIVAAVGIMLAIIMTLMVVAMPRFKKQQTLIDRLNLVAREILTGIPVIRAFTREKHEEERFGEAAGDVMKNQLFTTRTMTLMMPLMMVVMNGIVLSITWFGGHAINDGNMQVGSMMAFITYTMQIIMAFMMISAFSIFLPRAAVASERVDEVLSTQPSVRDPKHPKKLKNVEGKIAFENVSFKFPGADENVLEDISFEALPGQTTAIIGSTGSGKSTLVHLIPRLFDVTGGAVKLDGIDIRDVTQHDLHQAIGFVPQKGLLFSGDVESNIKFGAPDISDQAMEKAAEIAQAASFIAEKDDGYQSHISQGGDNVSGGQRQRLSIARAIAKDSKVFVFDDSFSALDFKTDVALRRALSENLGGVTVIIVAQRISTILHADKIIVLDDGKIVGMGRHEELLKTCDIYNEIATGQLSPEELGLRKVGVGVPDGPQTKGEKGGDA